MACRHMVAKHNQQAHHAAMPKHCRQCLPHLFQLGNLPGERRQLCRSVAAASRSPPAACCARRCLQGHLQLLPLLTISMYNMMAA